MKVTEEKLWDYIDGLLSEEEKSIVEISISGDIEVYKTYQGLLSLNNSFENLQLDAPSMSFDKNVMDKIKERSVPFSGKAKIDKKIIFGFTIFLLLISAIIFFTFYQTSDSSTILSISFSFFNDLLNISDSLKSSLVVGFLMFNIIGILLIFDKILNAKKNKEVIKN
jgi:hypothetical protein